MFSKRISCVLLCALLLCVVVCDRAAAITGYGVNAAGTLFRFDVDSPASVTTLGNVGFVPEGIDFRPSTNQLYAINVGPVTTQLYTLNLHNGTPTPVGAGFASTVAGSYDLTTNNTFGFDFNPTTLQADNSMRIRLVATNGDNLRLNSSTGLVAVVDTDLLISPSGASPFVDAAAYINNIATMGGTTELYDMDSRNNSLYRQSPPNAGTLNLVGPFGATIDNTIRNIGFDIYTDPTSVDTGIGGDFAFAVLKRPDAPFGGVLGSYLLYDVNLATGGISNGALVGPAATPFDFEGGFAVIPEPSSLVLLVLGCLGTVRRRAR